jgi:hypothetical protein
MAASIAAVKVAFMKLRRTNKDINMFVNHAVQIKIIIQTDYPGTVLNYSFQRLYIGGKLSPTEFK